MTIDTNVLRRRSGVEKGGTLWAQSHGEGVYFVTVLAVEKHLALDNFIAAVKFRVFHQNPFAIKPFFDFCQGHHCVGYCFVDGLAACEKLLLYITPSSEMCP